MLKFLTLIAFSLPSSVIFAANFTTQSVSDVSSIQLNSDGEYNVICKNGSFEVVNSDDITENNVCPHVPKPPPLPIVQDGTYHDSTTDLCDQKLHAQFENETLKSVRIDYPTCYGSFLEAACQNNSCIGVSASQQIQVDIINPTSYIWTNVSFGQKSTFLRIGDLTLSAPYRVRRTSSGLAGE